MVKNGWRPIFPKPQSAERVLPWKLLLHDSCGMWLLSIKHFRLLIVRPSRFCISGWLTFETYAKCPGLTYGRYNLKSVKEVNKKYLDIKCAVRSTFTIKIMLIHYLNSMIFHRYSFHQTGSLSKIWIEKKLLLSIFIYSSWFKSNKVCLHWRLKNSRNVFLFFLFLPSAQALTLT